MSQLSQMPQRGYFAGLVLIMVASFNALMRRGFFPNSSPDPAQIGGVFRLVNALNVTRWASALSYQRDSSVV